MIHKIKNFFLSYLNRRIYLLILLSFLLFPIFFIAQHMGSKCFYDDYCDNLFLASYYSFNFFQDFSFPIYFNGETIGSPLYLVYGYTIYPFIGLPSLVLSSEMSYKFLMIIFQIIKLTMIYRILSEYIVSKKIISILSVAILWSIFNNSVIFSTGSLPSSFGFELASISIIALIYYLKKDEDFYFYLSIYFIAFSLFTWPPHIIHITVVYLPIILYVVFIKRIYKKFISNIFFLMLLFSPYLIELVISAMTLENYNWELGYYAHMDSITNRLLPIPYDSQSFFDGIKPFTTPHHDVQINTLTIFLIVFLVPKIKFNKKRIVIFLIYFSLFMIYFILSISPEFAEIFPRIFTRLHQHHRYIFYLELCLLILVICSISWVNPKQKINFHKLANFFLIILILSIGIKTFHNYQSQNVPPFNGWQKKSKKFVSLGSVLSSSKADKESVYWEVPRSAAQLWAYNNLKPLDPTAKKCDVKRQYLLKPKNNNENYYLNFNNKTNSACYLNINVFPFSQHVLLLNGKLIPEENKFRTDDYLGTYVLFAKGESSLQLELYTPKIPEFFRNLNLIVITSIFIIFIVIFFNKNRKDLLAKI